MTEYTLADAIIDDPFIGFAILAFFALVVFVGREVIWKPLRASYQRRAIDRIKLEQEVHRVGRDVADGQRRAFPFINGQPPTTNSPERLTRHG